MSFRVLHPVDDRDAWDQAIAMLPYDVRDPYMSSAWARLHLTPTQQPGLALYIDDRKGFLICQPIVVRRINETHLDVTSQGYGGPVSSLALAGAEDGEAFEAAYAVWRKANNIVSEFYLLNPIHAAHQWVLLPNHAELVPRQTVYIVPVDHPDAMRSRMRKTRQQSLDKASGAILSSEAHPDLMSRLYASSMEGRAADVRYSLPLDFFARMKEHLGDNVKIVGAGNPETGRAEAVATFVMGPSCTYYYAAATVRRLDGYADSCIVFAMELARQKGNHWLHLGGGLQDGDTLASYKRSFGGFPRRTYSMCRVYDREAYIGLTGILQREPNFFPAYRAKVVT